MNILRRAWISITRRKSNSIAMFLLVFTLANVLLITLTVNNSIKNTKEVVLNQFPPVVDIDYNHENYDAKTPDLTLDKVETLYDISKDIVRSYDYALNTTIYKTENTKHSYISDNMDSLNEIEVLIYAEGTQLSSTSLVEREEAKLIDGKGFSEDDIINGSAKVIVSKQFAEANALDVGTFMSLDDTRYDSYVVGGGEFVQGELVFSEAIELEVVGIIEIKEIEDFLKEQSTKESKDLAKTNEIQRLADQVYTPNNFIEPIIEAKEELRFARFTEKEKGSEYSQFDNISPEFILKDMKYLDEFTKYAKAEYNEKDFTISSAASEYETVAKPLNSMSSLLDLVFKITIVSSILIITLTLILFMYFRKQEMGILLALGEKHEKIFMQLLIETLLIAIVATTLAIFTSIIFSNMLMEDTINSLMNADVSNIYIPYDSGFGLDAETIAQQYQGGFGIMTIVVFYTTIIATIIISQLATMLYLIRLNPKKILM